MALAVPRQAYAGAHFGKVYDGDTYNSRISHHPTVNEPWITAYFGSTTRGAATAISCTTKQSRATMVLPFM